MSTTRSRKWFTNKTLISGIILGFLLIQLLFDPISLALSAVERIYVIIELPRARARWEAAGIRDYQVGVRAYVPLVCFSSGLLDPANEKAAYETLTVRQDTLISPSPSPCRQTVLEAFAAVEQYLAGSRIFDGRLVVRFDRKFGYITRYMFTSSPPCLGLLCPRIFDSTITASFIDLVPLPAP